MDNQIKAQFFAQYYFQKVLFTKSEKFNPVYLVAESLEFRVPGNFPKDFLLLRSVEQLTDEECINVDYLLNPKNQIDIESNRVIKELHIGIIKTFLNQENSFNRPLFNTLCITDYLRSISILVPFTYLNEENKPVTLSPDEIIKLGWAKIINAQVE